MCLIKRNRKKEGDFSGLLFSGLERGELEWRGGGRWCWEVSGLQGSGRQWGSLASGGLRSLHAPCSASVTAVKVLCAGAKEWPCQVLRVVSLRVHLHRALCLAQCFIVLAFTVCTVGIVAFTVSTKARRTVFFWDGVKAERLRRWGPLLPSLLPPSSFLPSSPSSFLLLLLACHLPSSFLNPFHNAGYHLHP